MKSFFVLGLVVAMAAAAYAQAPKPCTVPVQFQTRVSEFDHALNAETRYLLTYDEINRRVHIFEEIHAHQPGRHFFERIALFRENVEYLVDLSASPQTCKKVPLSRQWRDWQVPANATLITTGTVGIAGDGTTFSEWGMNVRGTSDWWTIRVTERSCVPLFEAFGKTIATDKTLFYWDFVVGVPDPNVFVPPAACRNL